MKEVIEGDSVTRMGGASLVPNEHGDWLSQRRDDFETFLPIGDKSGGPAIFDLYSLGLATGRDAWVGGSSSHQVLSNVHRMATNYNALVEQTGAGSNAKPVKNAKHISWNRNLDHLFARGRRLKPDDTRLRVSAYRPFFKQHTYFERQFNAMVYRLYDLFPTPTHGNLGFAVVTPQGRTPFASLATDFLPSLGMFMDPCQYYARWRYENVDDDGMLNLEDSEREVVDGYRKIDNITDGALAHFQDAYGVGITKDDIFYYCYGLLNSPDYRETYAADLKKVLPRIPLVTDATPYIDAGRRLSDLHLRYETVPPYPLTGLDVEGPAGDTAYDFFRVLKMRFGKPTADQKEAGQRADKTTIVYNSNITLRGIPEEAYRYMLGSRSAIEWIIDRYQVKTDKASGIVNDPNEWSREVDDPRYILDLVARIVTVSLETMRIVDGLPDLEILPVEGQA